MFSNSSHAGLDVVIRNSLTDPEGPPNAPIHYYKKGNVFYYKVWIFLDGRDLPYIDSVTYYLHESFRDPIRRIPRSPSNPNCLLITWTWGTFELRAEVMDKKGNIFSISKDLDWDRDLTDGKKYVEERTAS